MKQLILLCALLAAQAVAFAQSDTLDAGKGQLLGQVANNDVVLPYAKVVVYRKNTFAGLTHADSNGSFAFTNLPEGWYNLKAVTAYNDVLISKPVYVKNNNGVEEAAFCDAFYPAVARKVVKKPALPVKALTVQVDSIVVFKSRREMKVYGHGNLLKTYRVCLGSSPQGAKQFEGDGKTPEGKYYINDKNPYSSFHKSLGISYPSAADIAFAKKNGKKPGGLVKVHGLPNGATADDYVNEDWTWGCIAVNDVEIDELYSHIQTGIPINILQ
jgi:hypothetical protein